jgi:diguanylate cyclase (GGDEF)-like protein/PAS domain S-box-containing protein
MSSGGTVGLKKYRPHILVLFVLAVVLLSGMHGVMRNILTDMRFRWLPHQASGAVVLVAIDSPSIEKIGVWPWPRQLHAKLIGRLEQAGATDIVFDVDFSSASNDEADKAFGEALQKAGGSVVLPVFKQRVVNGADDGSIYVSQPLPQFAKHAWPAVVNVAVEPDGLVRHYAYGEVIDGKFLPSVGALLAGKFATTQRPLQIDFSIAASVVPTVSYVDVLRGDPAALKTISGKKVLIGATAVELGDRFNVPNGAVIPGPMLQILAAESILQGRVLRTTSSIVPFAGLAVLVALMMLLWGRLQSGTRVVVLVGLSAAAEAGAFWLQARSPVVVDTSLLHAAVAAYLAALALDEIDFRRLLGVIAEKRFRQIAMSLGDGLVCADENGRITVWNPGAEAMFGYRSEEIIGQPLDTLSATGAALLPTDQLPIAEPSAGAIEAPGGHLVEFQGRRKTGEIFPLEACFSRWQGVDGFQYGAVMRDITARQREAERIRYLAEHDTLTGLANRNSLHDHLEATLAEAKTAGTGVAFLMLDLDKFKLINDTLGHASGDQLLRDVAARLDKAVADTGLVARLSGDEFAIVLQSDTPVEAADKILKRLSEAFCDNFYIGLHQLRVRTSIGVAVYPTDCTTAEELLGNADLALYHAKGNGRGKAVFFERSIRDTLEARLSLEADLERALEREEFELYYQPQVNLRDGAVIGAEALIRWRSPTRGFTSPDQFMPVVNATSIAGGVAQWVLQTACRQNRAWQDKGHRLRLGVNLSPCQFQSDDLPVAVGAVLAETGLSPSLLELEVTENILLEDDEKARDIFARIQALGVHIAFDDFGTGYASLTYLKRFALDRLKIDRSFVTKLRSDSDDMAIVSAAINLGRKFGMEVIAEGIEDADTAELLWRSGCETGQGYYYGKPMPAAEFEQRFLAEGAGKLGAGKDAKAVTAA